MWPFTSAPARRAPEEKISRTAQLVALGSLGRPVWSPRDYNCLAREGYAANPVVYRCVRMISEAAASVPLYVYDSGMPVSVHPLIALLGRPNPRQAGAAFLESVVGYLLIAGNAYIEAVQGSGGIAEIYALRPDRMKVVPGPDGWPQAYEYTVGGGKVSFNQDDGIVPPILQLTFFHPTNDHYGLAPLEAAAVSLDILSASASWNKALLDNSARPSGALVYAPSSGAALSREQFERLKDELEQSFQGAANAGRPLLLEGGLDWRPLSLTPKDMDFLETKNAAARDVALAFGVPPMLLGIPGDATYANYQEANRAFWRQTVLPLLNRICQSLSHWLAPIYGAADLRFDADTIEALAPDRNAIWKRVNDATFLTDDEKRAAVGYEPQSGQKKFAPAGQIKYSPSQPRVSAGHPTGGQWTSDGTNNDSARTGVGGDDNSGDSSAIVSDAKPANVPSNFPDDRINTADDVFLLLGAATSLAKLGARAAIGVADYLTSSALGESAVLTNSSAEIQAGARAIEDYLGGPPERVIENNGNWVFMRGDKKISFDISNEVEEPHFQLEILEKNQFGKPEWTDAIPGKENHHFPFKGQ